jgi:uncharacterized protein
MSWFRWQGPLLLLQLHIQPGARQNLIVGLHGDRLKLKIHAPPVDGKANAELIDFIAHCFGINKSTISILKGELGRDKTLCIADVRKLPPALVTLGLTHPV